MAATLTSLLKIQLNLHRGFCLPDFYKFIYQASLGCEHAVDDPELSYSRLLKEVAGLTYAGDASLTEQLSPDGVLIRVNLLPYRKLGGNLPLLNRVFH